MLLSDYFRCATLLTLIIGLTSCDSTSPTEGIEEGGEGLDADILVGRNTYDFNSSPHGQIIRLQIRNGSEKQQNELFSIEEDPSIDEQVLDVLRTNEYMYASVRSRGVYRQSPEVGGPWNLVNEDFAFSRIVQGPNGNIIGFSPGVYRSSDSGKTWQQVAGYLRASEYPARIGKMYIENDLDPSAHAVHAITERRGEPYRIYRADYRGAAQATSSTAGWRLVAELPRTIEVRGPGGLCTAEIEDGDRISSIAGTASQLVVAGSMDPHPQCEFGDVIETEWAFAAIYKPQEQQWDIRTDPYDGTPPLPRGEAYRLGSARETFVVDSKIWVIFENEYWTPDPSGTGWEQVDSDLTPPSGSVKELYKVERTYYAVTDFSIYWRPEGEKGWNEVEIGGSSPAGTIKVRGMAAIPQEDE